MLYLEELADEMDMQFDGTDTFVHRTTGEFLYLDTEYYSLAEEVDMKETTLENRYDWEKEAVAKIIDYWEHSEDYVSLPESYEINEYSIMEDFIDQLSHTATQDRLEWAIRGRGAFRRFKDTIEDLGISQQWYDFKAQALLKIAKEWCENQGITYQLKGANQ